MESWLHPVFDAEGMRAADSWAIQDRGIPSLELMETAGDALAETVRELARPGPVRVVCGKGNNGGDGLVAARHLAMTGHEVDVLLLWPASELSPDAVANLERLPVDAVELEPGAIEGSLDGSGAVVDAIFGTGFAGAPRAPVDAAIAAVNGCGAPVIAADIASGVDASTGEVAGAAIEARATVSFHAAKLGHWIAPGKWMTGELRVVPIGIPDGAPSLPAAGVIGDGALELPPGRGSDSTKFSSGQVVVIGGSRGLTGAACMASLAAIRAGAGYATAAVPADLEETFEVKLTEVMTVGCEGPPGHLGGPVALEQILEAVQRAESVVLGPGAGRDDATFELVRGLLPRVGAKLLLDADGLNSIAGRPEALRDRPGPTVITPHAGELARLLGTDGDDVSAQRLRSARDAAAASGAVVVLKGDDTLVVEGERLAISPGNSPALATAGTGDVLSGTIGALLARGLEPFEAACAGVLAHVHAGRIAATRVGAVESVIATDVIGALPAALAGEGP